MAPPEVRTSGDISAAAEGGDSSGTTTSVCDAQPPLSTSQDNDQVAVSRLYI